MAGMIEFFVDIEPEAKGRPRFYRRGRYVGTYTPKKTLSFEARLKLLVSAYRPVKPVIEPVYVALTFCMPIPKSRKKKLKQGDYHIIKPDIDNLVKSALDPLCGVFWKDDAVICQLSVCKVYAETPGIRYSIGPAWSAGEVIK